MKDLKIEYIKQALAQEVLNLGLPPEETEAQLKEIRSAQIIINDKIMITLFDDRVAIGAFGGGALVSGHPEEGDLSLLRIDWCDPEMVKEETAKAKFRKYFGERSI